MFVDVKAKTLLSKINFLKAIDKSNYLFYNQKYIQINS
jgi:hypothetical protein